MIKMRKWEGGQTNREGNSVDRGDERKTERKGEERKNGEREKEKGEERKGRFSRRSDCKSSTV